MRTEIRTSNRGALDVTFDYHENRLGAWDDEPVQRIEIEVSEVYNEDGEDIIDLLSHDELTEIERGCMDYV